MSEQSSNSLNEAMDEVTDAPIIPDAIASMEMAINNFSQVLKSATIVFVMISTPFSPEEKCLC